MNTSGSHAKGALEQAAGAAKEPKDSKEDDSAAVKSTFAADKVILCTTNMQLFEWFSKHTNENYMLLHKRRMLGNRKEAMERTWSACGL
jgi:hypothetical protein